MRLSRLLPTVGSSRQCLTPVTLDATPPETRSRTSPEIRQQLPSRVTLKLREVKDGCKLCGKRMLTPDSPLIRRTCDACKAERRREQNRKLDVRRKAERDAAKAKRGTPRCKQCGKLMKGAVRLASTGWVRRFCGDACRQAAHRAG